MFWTQFGRRYLPTRLRIRRSGYSLSKSQLSSELTLGISKMAPWQPHDRQLGRLADSSRFG
jgi:hypothetical protein